MNLPDVVTLAGEVSRKGRYDNHVIAAMNDHVVRISVMTEPFYWHSHPNSDEVFLVMEGRLCVELRVARWNWGRGRW